MCGFLCHTTINTVHILTRWMNRDNLIVAIYCFRSYFNDLIWWDAHTHTHTSWCFLIVISSSVHIVIIIWSLSLALFSSVCVALLLLHRNLTHHVHVHRSMNRLWMLHFIGKFLRSLLYFSVVSSFSCCRSRAFFVFGFNVCKCWQCVVYPVQPTAKKRRRRIRKNRKNEPDIKCEVRMSVRKTAASFRNAIKTKYAR